MRRRSHVALVAVAALMLSACGGGGGGKDLKDLATDTTDDTGTDTTDDTGTDTTDDTGTDTTDDTGGEPVGGDDDYIDAITENLVGDPDAPASLTEDEARCLAEAMVDAGGAQAIADAGLTPDEIAAGGDLGDIGTELGPDEALAMGRAFADCVDFGELLAASFGESVPGVDASAADCIGDALGDGDLFAELLASSILGQEPPPESAAALADAIIDCVDFGAAVAASGGVDLTDDEIACLDDGLKASDEFRALMAASVNGEEAPDGTAAVLEVLTGCLTPERLVELGLSS